MSEEMIHQLGDVVVSSIAAITILLILLPNETSVFSVVGVLDDFVRNIIFSLTSIG